MYQSFEEEENERLEREHFQRIINAFKYYRTHSMFRVVSAEKYYHNLPPHHKALVPSFLPHLDRVKACIGHNYEVIRAIIKNTDKMFENADPSIERRDLVKTHVPTAMDMDKVKTTLKQFVRDWSREGAAERDACYGPIIADIETRFPCDRLEAAEIQILVPGAGLGRLAYEIAKRGYSCQGNEWSLFMLFASNFVLNKCRTVGSLTLYPYVHQFSNNRTSDHQVEPISIPDVSPADLPENAQFSMAAGDFLDVYRQAEAWDAVATAFFLDTAHNVIAYVETIWNILRPGGIWINLGPLLYHFADMPNESSIELSYEDLKKVILQFGFVFRKEDTNVRTTYNQNPNSMLKYEYECVYFVVEKPEEAFSPNDNVDILEQPANPQGLSNPANPQGLSNPHSHSPQGINGRI